MTEPATTPNPVDEADCADGWERALLDRQLEALGRLADMGMAIAGAIERGVTADPPGSQPDTVLHHAAMDFARVARAVRMTFALQSRLIADFKGRTRSAEAAGSDEGPYEVVWAGEPSQLPEAQTRRVQRIVRRAAEDAGYDNEAVERLVLEAGERLEHDDIYGDLMSRPFDEIVALICKDLGLQPDWDSLAGEPWAQASNSNARPPPLAGEGDHEVVERAFRRTTPETGCAPPTSP